MKVGRLKELLKGLNDDTEIFIRNSRNACGNISDLDQLEKSSYGFMGTSIDCIILNSCVSKAIEQDEQGNIKDLLITEGK